MTEEDKQQLKKANAVSIYYTSSPKKREVKFSPKFITFEAKKSYTEKKKSVIVS